MQSECGFALPAHQGLQEPTQSWGSWQDVPRVPEVISTWRPPPPPLLLDLVMKHSLYLGFLEPPLPGLAAPTGRYRRPRSGPSSQTAAGPYKGLRLPAGFSVRLGPCVLYITLG